MPNKTVIVDLDGTLALNEHRNHFIDKSNGKKVNWIAYFDACDQDLPNIPVIKMVNLLKKEGYQIHIFSGRSDIVKGKTINWLSLYEVSYDELTMREHNSYIADDDLKHSWLMNFYPNYKEEIFCVIDDRDKVVKMWRKLGLTCFQVAEGNF